MVARSLGTSWIKSYVETVAQSPHCSTPSRFPCPRKRNVQLVKFLTFGKDPNDDCIWAYVADSDCLAIPAKFTQAAITNLGPGDKLIDHLNGLVVIDQYHLVFSRIPRDGAQGGMTTSSTLSLEVHEMRVVGDHDPLDWRGVDEISSTVHTWIRGLRSNNGHIIRDHNRVQETGPPESSKQAIQRSLASTPPKKRKTPVKVDDALTVHDSQFRKPSLTKEISSSSYRTHLLRNLSMPLHVKELLDAIEDDWGIDLCEGPFVEIQGIPSSARSSPTPHSSYAPARATTPDEWLATQQGGEEDTEYNPFDGECQGDSGAGAVSPRDPSPAFEVPLIKIEDEQGPAFTPESSPAHRPFQEAGTNLSPAETPDPIARHCIMMKRRVPPPPHPSPTKGSLHGSGRVLVENSDVSMSQSQSQTRTQTDPSSDGNPDIHTHDEVQPLPPAKHTSMNGSPVPETEGPPIPTRSPLRTTLFRHHPTPEKGVATKSQKSTGSTTEDESPLMQALYLVDIQDSGLVSPLPDPPNLDCHEIARSHDASTETMRDRKSPTNHTNLSQISTRFPYTPAASRQSSASSEGRSKVRPRVSYPRPSITKSAFLGGQDIPANSDYGSALATPEQTSSRAGPEVAVLTNSDAPPSHIPEEPGPPAVTEAALHKTPPTTSCSDASSTSMNTRTTVSSSKKSGPTIASMREFKRHSFIIQTEDGVVRAVDVNAPRLYLGKRTRSESSSMMDETLVSVPENAPRRPSKIAKLDHLPALEPPVAPAINMPMKTSASTKADPAATSSVAETEIARAVATSASQGTPSHSQSVTDPLLGQRPREILRNWRSFLGPSTTPEPEIPPTFTWQRLAHVTLQSLRYKHQLAKQ